MDPEHCELHQVCGIEKHVGFFLKRIYPPDLGTAHVGPVRYGLGRSERAVVVIPHYPAQQTVVACGNAVVIVEGYAHDGVYENLVLAAGGHLLRKADGPRHAEMMAKKNEPDFNPTFRGHSDLRLFTEWVNKNLKYPKDARDAHIEGTVKLQFTVGTNGGVQEVQILQGVYPSLDNEALRVVHSSPKWKPGIKDGKPIRVTYPFSVTFALPE